MLLINKNVKPNKTIYYLSSRVYKKLIYDNYSVKDLYNNLQLELQDLDYKHFLYALNFLYLVDKVKIEGNVIKLC